MEFKETTVCLRVMGDHLDPDAITRRLRVEPTHVARKGDTRITATSRTIVQRIGIWSFAPDLPGDLNAQIAGLLDLIPDEPEVWLTLAHEYRCDVFCGVFMEFGNEGAELQPDVLARLGACGLTLGLDIYAGSGP